MIGGIDLAALPKNPTGLCKILNTPVCATVHRDDEIIEWIQGVKIVAIDAPLWEGEPFRPGERKLISRGFRPLPTNMESMRILRRRAMGIAETLRSLGVEVIETFPSAFRHPILDVKTVRKRLGIKNRHERDALLCAIAAKGYLDGRYEDLGGIIVVSKDFVLEVVNDWLSG